MAVERELDELIAAPPDVVRGYYVDLDRIVDVHPLVVSVRTVSHQILDDGY